MRPLLPGEPGAIWGELWARIEIGTCDDGFHSLGARADDTKGVDYLRWFVDGVVFQYGDQEMCMDRMYSEGRKPISLPLFSAIDMINQYRVII
jgi:hypothetical protein